MNYFISSLRRFSQKSKNKFYQLREKFQQSVVYKILIIAFLIIFSLVLAFLIEKYCFNLNANYKNYLDKSEIKESYIGFKKNKDGTLTAQDWEPSLIFQFPESYVYKFSFYGKSKSHIDILYDFVCPEANRRESEFLRNSFNSSLETITVDAETDSFYLKFYDCKGQTIDIEIRDLIYERPLNPMRLAVCFLILLLISFLVLQLTGFIEFKYEVIALSFILIFGGLFSFLLPPRYNADEWSHLIKTLDTANLNLITQEDENTYLPTGFEKLHTLTYRSYEDFQKELEKLSINRGTSYYPKALNSTAASYFFVPYIFASLGMNVARLFRLPIFYWAQMAKFFNVLFYAGVIYFSIKLFPTNKPLMLFMAILPLMLDIASSTGTGMMLSACLFLLISLVAYFITTKKEVSYLTYLALLFIIFLIAICRMPSGLVGLILLLIPNKQFKGYLKYSNKIITIIFMLLSMYFVYWYENYISLELLELEGVNATKQIELVLRKPFVIIKRLWDNMVYSYLNTFPLITQIGYMVYNSHISGLATTVGFITMIILSLSGNKDELAFGTGMKRISLILIFFLTIGVILMSLYIVANKVNSATLVGMQERYIVPLLIIPLLAFEGKTFYLNVKELTLRLLTIVPSLYMLIMSVGSLVFKFYS